LGKYEEAYKFFGFATRMDLDNYNRNSSEGLHTTSIAAAWMNIVYGFAGMRSDRERLSFYPTIPKQWSGYAFSIHYSGDVIKVNIQKDRVYFHTENGSNIIVQIYGNTVELGKEVIAFEIPSK
jgi:maltose phosphorylase